ncbi:membrane protein [Sporolactobacillus inulinus CASD]|uniref:Membrane protein n=2 Tax=Sporolactobacillus inulinus TaxID=2078 RepID=A0A0U1QR94_9BACL|nr:membrane protein [Sporolactobacillus inulinus CASD]
MDVAIKLVIGLICLVISINMSGKGNLAPLSAADQIQNYVLGGIIGGVIYNPDITIMQFLIVLLIWSGLIITMRILKTKNSEVRKWIDGDPIVIVNKGRMIPKNFKKANLSVTDFATMLRMQDIYTIKDVSRAQVEQNGHLTVLKKDNERLGFILVAEGSIDYDMLDLMDKDEQWLVDVFRNMGIESKEDVFCAEYYKGSITVYTDDMEKQTSPVAVMRKDPL